ncbi:MAG TPA: CBS domain-containing protein [Pseudomonadales bacterium]|nr:CBS domain-containing protein [Pseudomonadales bacterium]
MDKPQNIEQCMHRSPLTITQDKNIVDAVEMMLEYKLTGLTVVDDHSQVVGVISEVDCIRAILNAIYNDGEADEAGTVADFMTKSVNFCVPSDGIVEVAESMLATKQRRRPVIADGKLVGQVSSGNILWALMEFSRRKVRRS